jgi:hypothetical protein
MQPVSDNIRRALLAVLADVLIYARSWVSSPDGLAPEHCVELNRLFNLTHNVPGFIDGSYMLGFDEARFTGALLRFDQRNLTGFAKVYADARDSADVASVTHFKFMADFIASIVATDIELLDHQYHHAAFGSWCITVRRHRLDFRILFDGKDSAYQLDRTLPGNPPKFEKLWQGRGPRETVPVELVDALRGAG